MTAHGRERETGTALGAALGMVVLAFLLPFLCFGGAAEPAEEDGDAAETETPAVLVPIFPADTAGAVDMDAVAGELDSARTVRVLTPEGETAELDMGDYLWGVVAAEMPAAFEAEALKAQTVAARTYTLWKSAHNSAHAQADVCTDFACCQAWISREEAGEKWGENAALYTAKITAAIAATDGMVLTWEGQPIQAVFHSSSNGRTEDAVAVWGSTVPYLQGVDTPEGEEVPNYRSTAVFSPDALAEALNGYGCDFSGDPAQWLGELTRTENGGVASAEVGGISLTGPQVRAALGLRSASFTAAYDGEAFTFSVTGYGHGVGLSQYGANALAAAGKSWQEIAAWYYTGVTVEPYPA